MNSSGNNRRHEKEMLFPEGRPVSERFVKTESLPAGSVQVDTGSVMVLPALEQEYRIIHELSSGGTSVISLAEDRFLKRQVALKSLSLQHCADPKRRRAFIREAQLMAQLEHPSIVPVHGIARDSSGGLHIIMKHVHGESLREYLKNLREMYAAKKLSRSAERKSLHDRIELFIRICDAVAFAHSKKVLHGDLKPGNIMIEHSHNIYHGLGKCIGHGDSFGRGSPERYHFRNAVLSLAGACARGIYGLPFRDFYSGADPF